MVTLFFAKMVNMEIRCRAVFAETLQIPMTHRERHASPRDLGFLTNLCRDRSTMLIEVLQSKVHVEKN